MANKPVLILKQWVSILQTKWGKEHGELEGTNCVR